MSIASVCRVEPENIKPVGHEKAKQGPSARNGEIERERERTQKKRERERERETNTTEMEANSWESRHNKIGIFYENRLKQSM